VQKVVDPTRCDWRHGGRHFTFACSPAVSPANLVASRSTTDADAITARLSIGIATATVGH
jgi:hypothetical protein